MNTSEVPFQQESGSLYIHQVLNFDLAYESCVSKLKHLEKHLNAERSILCFTDYESNWRTSVLPSYKENRRSWEKFKPFGLLAVKKRLSETYESFTRPTLEADDCMGILATWPKYQPDYEKIIVSEDKDMQTIPTLLVNPSSDWCTEQGTFVPRRITQEQADTYHMQQTLSGDTVDGYKGCVGIGSATAKKLLANMMAWEKPEGSPRWKSVPARNLWHVVKSNYEKRGLTESDALTQARVARICRAADYDFKKKEVKLWR